MNVGNLLDYLTVFVLAILLGFEVISKVPATLHTPLMSGTNSIHGIVLVGELDDIFSVHQEGFVGVQGKHFPA